MSPSPYRKLVRLERLAEVAAEHRAAGRRVVLCHGCFDIVHPGHVRYLQWAAGVGDALVVSLTGDDGIEKQDGTRPHIPQELRAENLAALECVDHVVIVEDPTALPVIEALRPDVYVKGKEYEHVQHAGFVREKEAVEAHGGRVMFSSGDVVFSSSDIITDLPPTRAGDVGFDEADRLAACCTRWGIDRPWLRQTLGEGFAGKRVAVVGDSVCDRYVFCEQADVAAEAPVLSVRPVREQSFLGAAAIIAAHLRALGATPHLLTTTGSPDEDEASRQLLASLDRAGIAVTAYPTHRALPVKQRYLVDDQKVLKVNRADTRPLDSATQKQVLGVLHGLRTELDAVIFTDFGYGTVTAALLEQALPMLRPHVGTIAGDVSGAHRTLLAYHRADLLTPTERELRAVAADFEGSLPSIAGRVMSKLRVPNLIVTMGKRGAVLFRPRETVEAAWFESRLRSDYIPALAGRVDDPVGAGDAMLAAATLALAAGATLPQAGYLGSAAAAVALSRLGNLPVSADDLQRFAQGRGELRAERVSSAA